eukprot:m.59464 g.59464  ORF g.59464 m.59464 type:complete len:392 (+) comp11772_c0_seq2:77-1252(+)
MEVQTKWLDTFHPDEPKDVCVRFEIYSLSDVDTVNQNFSCDFAIEVSWEALEDDIRDGQKSNGDMDWDAMWNPRIRFRNAAHIHQLRTSYRLSHTLSQPIGDHNPDGKTWITCRIEVIGDFTFKMNLYHFPFDKQELLIIVRSQWRNSWLNFRPHPHPQYNSIVNLQHASCIDNEFLIDPIPNLDVELTEDDKHDGESSVYSANERGIVSYQSSACYVCAKADSWPIPNHTDTRHAGSGKSYPLVNLKIFPVFWICLAGAVSMIVNPEDETELLDQRMSVTLTLLLTLVAVKFVAAADIPNVSYVTWLDFYILVAFSVLILVGIQNVIAARVSTEARKWVDYAGLIFMGLVWIIGHIILLIVSFPLRAWKRRGSLREHHRYHNGVSESKLK